MGPIGFPETSSTILRVLTLEDGTDWLSRNVDNYFKGLDS